MTHLQRQKLRCWHRIITNTTLCSAWHFGIRIICEVVTSYLCFFYPKNVFFCRFRCVISTLTNVTNFYWSFFYINRIRVRGDKTCYRHVWSRVDSQLRVRVTDAALSRDLFPADYDQHDGSESGSRPTRWMALESLVERRASSASDMVRINSGCPKK